MTDKKTLESFQAFNLKAKIIDALIDLGYEEPSPIQEKSIPVILAGTDIIGQAQTGTGKTAAFALPSLNKLDADKKVPQILVLTPTRELALQVAASYESYAKHLKGVKVVAVYGGAPMGKQLRDLSNGAQIIVATPGRLVDHLRRNKAMLSTVEFMVLDEADEMLKMGFMDDLDIIFDAMPKQYQTALFSATLPPAIKKIAQNRLNNPVNIHIAAKTQTVERISQAYMMVYQEQKTEAILRILELEDYDAMICFVRTKQDTLNVVQALNAKGYKAAALNGDIAQNQREAVIDDLKNGSLDLVVATDVAARGIDVARITHVLNIDIPYDPESYVHRIGRTGRAGREGKALLLVTPRERRMLAMIEKVTNQQITEILQPSAETILQARVDKLTKQTSLALDLVASKHNDLLEHLKVNLSLDDESLAKALLAQIIKGKNFNLEEVSKEFPNRFVAQKDRKAFNGDKLPRYKQKDLGNKVRLQSNLGSKDGIEVKNLLGAIINEGKVARDAIGRIQIKETFSLIELPESGLDNVLHKLRNAKFAGKRLDLHRYQGN